MVSAAGPQNRVGGPAAFLRATRVTLSSALLFALPGLARGKPSRRTDAAGHAGTPNEARRHCNQRGRVIHPRRLAPPVIYKPWAARLRVGPVGQKRGPTLDLTRNHILRPSCVRGLSDHSSDGLCTPFCRVSAALDVTASDALRYHRIQRGEAMPQVCFSVPVLQHALGIRGVLRASTSATPVRPRYQEQSRARSTAPRSGIEWAHGL